MFILSAQSSSYPLPTARRHWKAVLCGSAASLLLSGTAAWGAREIPEHKEKPFDLALPLLAANEAPGAEPPPPEPDLTAAQTSTSAPPRLNAASTPVPPSLSVTVNLIRQLVELGVLPKEKADALLKQAEAEADEARRQLLAERDAIAQSAAAQVITAVQANPGLAAGGNSEPLPPPEQASRVTYVPEVVRQQLRDEIKRDLAGDASKDVRLPIPKSLEWIHRMRLFADLRVRGEGVIFPGGNDNTGSFPNFNAINTGAPFDTSGTEFSPQLNVDKNRERVRLRLRLGLESNLGDGFTAGLRLATGNTNTPTSTNQDLGLANNGQGGNFSKYAIWVDRAFLKWELGGGSDRSLAILAGRFDNPFFSTEAIFDEDLGFDGFAVQAKYRINKSIMPFLTAGAFPVFNTDFNFASTQPAKFSSDDKWLYAGQLGAVVKITPKIELKLAGAYYHFDNIEGRLSDPFVPLSANDQGNTDDTRPAFAQKGNTYRPLRNIIPTAENNFGTTNQFQYYGLATPFRNLAITGQIDFNFWDPFRVTLYGEYLKNLAFNRGAINSIAVNNRGANDSLGGLGRFDGGDTGWIIGLRLGHPEFLKRGDWAVGVNYRYLESDAVVDGFNDSDFGLGGTNLKGFSLWAGIALSPRVSLGARWTSADEIAGPPLSVDIVQLEVNAKF